MTTLKPVSRTTLSEQVAQQIVGLISVGKWGPGKKLPSETDLCRALHIGRSTLREALKSLAYVGMVRMRAGEGTYVADGPSKYLDRVLTHGLLNTEKDVSDLAETRMCLELESVGRCAQRATEGELQNLDSFLEKQKECLKGRGEAFLQLDLEMHLAIGAASRNMVLGQLLRTIRGLLQEYIYKSQQLPGARELAYAQHEKIVEAIRERKPRKAQSAMRKHLETFQRGYKILVQASESEPEVKPRARSSNRSETEEVRVGK